MTTKVCQVQAHHIKILHESDGPIGELEIPTLPQQRVQQSFFFGTSPRIFRFQGLWITVQESLFFLNLFPIGLLVIKFRNEYNNNNVEPHIYYPNAIKFTPPRIRY